MTPRSYKIHTHTATLTDTSPPGPPSPPPLGPPALSPPAASQGPRSHCHHPSYSDDLFLCLSYPLRQHRRPRTPPLSPLPFPSARPSLTVRSSGRVRYGGSASRGAGRGKIYSGGEGIHNNGGEIYNGGPTSSLAPQLPPRRPGFLSATRPPPRRGAASTPVQPPPRHGPATSSRTT
jgi:hypothetical protein